MSVLEYILSGAFLILLLSYVIKIIINNKFRDRTIDYMKNQKKIISELEIEKDKLRVKYQEVEKEKSTLAGKVEDQSKELEKINIILEMGIESQSQLVQKAILDMLGRISKDKKNIIESNLQSYNNLLNNVISWFQIVYNGVELNLSSFEINETIQEVINEISPDYHSKKITFINHLGEPVNVLADENIIKFVITTFSNLLAERSVSGNTMYIDIEKTGKKCLISFEDSGPGDNDEILKSLAGKNWDYENIKKSENIMAVNFLMSKDLIEKHTGNIWISSIMEIGLKITLSIPLD